MENLNPHLFSGSGSKSGSVGNVVLLTRFCQMVAALPRVCKNCGTHYTEGESEGQGCRYHPGARKLDNAWNSIWTCCGQKHTARGCVPRIRMHQDHHQNCRAGGRRGLLDDQRCDSGQVYCGTARSHSRCRRRWKRGRSRVAVRLLAVTRE